MDIPTTNAERQLLDRLMVIVKSLSSPNDLKFLNESVREDPRLLIWPNNYGRTLLHAGIYNKIGVEVISVLLQADPRTAAVKYQRRLPLHIALDSEVNLQVVYALMRAYPEAMLEADVDGRLPLHVILESTPFPAIYVELGLKLLEQCPVSASVMSYNKLPLHICLDQGLQPRLTLEVIRLYRGGTATRSPDGKLPLHLAVEYNSDSQVIEEIIEAYPAALMKPMVVARTQMTVLEYAIRSRCPEHLTLALMEGGSGRDPKGIAIARAVIQGKLTRVYGEEAQGPKNVGVPTKNIMSGHRKKFDVVVKPESGDSFKVDVLPDDKVETLRTRIQQREHVPEEKIKLIFRHPSQGPIQLMDGVELQEYDITTKGIVLDLCYRTMILHEALRNEAGKATTLKLLDLRPEAAAEDDQYGVLPLQLALQHFADEEVVLKVISKYPQAVNMELRRAAVGEYPLHLALKNKYSKAVISKLLERAHDRDWQRDPRTRQKTGAFCPEPEKQEPQSTMPLHLAILHGKSADSTMAIVEELLGKKCPVEARDPITGHSALDACLTIANVPFPLFDHIYKAVKFGTQPKICHEKGPNGQCLLHAAVINKANQAIIEMLCEEDKKHDGHSALLTRDIDGRLPIHLAASHRASFAVIRILILYCPQAIHERDGQGRTCLQLAVTHSAEPGVVFEITRADKASTTALDGRGRSLVELACAYDAPQWVVQEILEASPHDAENLNLLSGSWPNTKATAEALRIVMGMQRQGQPKIKVSSSSQGTNPPEQSLSTMRTSQNALPKEERSSIFGSWFNW